MTRWLWLCVTLLWMAAAASESGEREGGRSTGVTGILAGASGRSPNPATTAMLSRPVTNPAALPVAGVGAHTELTRFPASGALAVGGRPLQPVSSPAVPALGRLAVKERLRAEFSAWCPGLLGAPCQRCTGYWRGGILVKPASGVTAQGRRASPLVGKATTCPSWLEMGTRVRLLVPGWGAITRTCLDRGPQAAKDGTWQFDILVATHGEALAAFGGRGRARGFAEVLR